MIAKHILRHKLTSRMQYNLWFTLLGLLAVLFFSVNSFGFMFISSWFNNLKNIPSSPIETAMRNTVPPISPNNSNWINDFSISVSKNTPSAIIVLLCILWIVGIIVMISLIIKARFHFYIIKKSALPLQSTTIHKLYRKCLNEMNITKYIPIYSTAFLKSPVITGLFKPCIYIPIHLISNYNANAMRYMLLHELCHYKYKDALPNFAMNIIGVLYWFNPFVWYSLKEMKNDREVACNTSVLKLLEEDSYEDYGNTLINFAEKMSISPFPFATGSSGSMKQMKKRILNIATYHPVSFKKKLYGTLSFTLIVFVLFGFAPLLSIQAADQNRYYFNAQDSYIEYIDLSDIFKENRGSFVLFDTKKDSWHIYNKDYATTRISPASTFKIYSALFALESGIITPEHSMLSWNGQNYIYDLWNMDQTLESAMQNSVTWYFQTLDEQTGLSSIINYLHKTGYGNQTIEGALSFYWLNSSLKISPIEQVEMLKKLYYNQLDFAPENMEAIKNSIRLYTTEHGSLSGKTGTIEVDGQNTSGWFIGYIEKDKNTYFFATNIQNEMLASGPIATDLTFSILSELDIWKIE